MCLHSLGNLRFSCVNHTSTYTPWYVTYTFISIVFTTTHHILSYSLTTYYVFKDLRRRKDVRSCIVICKQEESQNLREEHIDLA